MPCLGKSILHSACNGKYKLFILMLEQRKISPKACLLLAHHSICDPTRISDYANIL